LIEDEELGVVLWEKGFEIGVEGCVLEFGVEGWGQGFKIEIEG